MQCTRLRNLCGDRAAEGGTTALRPEKQAGVTIQQHYFGYCDLGYCAFWPGPGTFRNQGDLEGSGGPGHCCPFCVCLAVGMQYVASAEACFWWAKKQAIFKCSMPIERTQLNLVSGTPVTFWQAVGCLYPWMFHTRYFTPCACSLLFPLCLLTFDA